MRTEGKAAQTESFWEEGERGLGETSAKCHPQTHCSPKHLGFKSTQCVFLAARTPIAETGPSCGPSRAPTPVCHFPWCFISFWAPLVKSASPFSPRGDLFFPILRVSSWKMFLGNRAWADRCGGAWCAGFGSRSIDEFGLFTPRPPLPCPLLTVYPVPCGLLGWGPQHPPVDIGAGQRGPRHPAGGSCDSGPGTAEGRSVSHGSSPQCDPAGVTDSGSPANARLPPLLKCPRSAHQPSRGSTPGHRALSPRSPDIGPVLGSWCLRSIPCPRHIPQASAGCWRGDIRWRSRKGKRLPVPKGT